MMRATRQAQMSPPELEDHRTYFRVVFSNDTMLDEATVEWLNQFAGLDLNEQQRLALAYTLHQQEISNGIYCRLTGADSREATDELRDLVAKGLLLPTGTRRWTTYRLSPRAAQSTEEEGPQETGLASHRMIAAERQERVCRLIAERGPISARSIRQELSIPRATLQYDLRKLTEAGRIVRTSEDPKDPRAQYQLSPEKK